ncbi:MAG: hypothetical protein GXO87_08170 [Chlorobi bacterium]|nr:hypothetical protein [Chlorobiota bacterium]
MNVIFNKGTNVYNFIKSAEFQTEAALKTGVIASQGKSNSPHNFSDAETAQIISESKNQTESGNYALTVLRNQSQPSTPVQKVGNISPSFLEIVNSSFSELKRTLFNDDELKAPTKYKKSNSEIITTPGKGYFLTIPDKYIDELKIDGGNPARHYSHPVPKGILVNIIA